MGRLQRGSLSSLFYLRCPFGHGCTGSSGQERAVNGRESVSGRNRGEKQEEEFFKEGEDLLGSHVPEGLRVLKGFDPMGRRAIAKIIRIVWVSLLLTSPALAQSHGDGCMTSLFAGDPSGDYFIAVMGANGVIYYTFIDTFRTESWDFNLGPESTNPFANSPLNAPVDTDSGSPFPGRAGVDVPWQPIPSSASASSGPFCTTVRTGTGENENMK